MRQFFPLLLLSACSGSDLPPSQAPDLLSEAGLYADITSETLADGVVAFTPAYPLWSDGSEKRRWIYLPPGSTIDSSNMDDWVFPVGTRLYKEFQRNGVKMETRRFEKLEDGAWDWVAYEWNSDGTEADRVGDEGLSDVHGTAHDVPSREGCQSCHGMGDQVLGFSALQLDHEEAGWTLEDLVDEGRLSDAPGDLDLPGDDVSAAALGYLHANCGNCHRDGAENPLRLRLRTSDLSSVEATGAYTTAVGQSSALHEPLADTDATVLIAPGNPEASLVYVRMSRRGERTGQMPWLGTEDVHDDGLEAVAAWITALGTP